jgi:serpin B
MKTSNRYLTLISGISIIFIVCCGQHALNSVSDGPANNQSIITTQEGSVTVKAYCGGRDSLPFSSPEDLETLVKGNTDFAFDMYKKLQKADINTFFSPYSISVALAMTWAGARTHTESEIASVLHFSLGQAQIHPVFDALDLALKSQAQKDGFDLNIVNQLWGEKTFDFVPEYLKIVSVNYGASMRLLDFISSPDLSRITINSWVSDQTKTRIEDLIPQGVITDQTRLVLTNAIYFKAQWADTFRKESTYDWMFYRNNDSTMVPFMHRQGSYRYIANADFCALEMPYKGNGISMLLILPQPGKMSAVESGLTYDFIAGLSGSLQENLINVSLPKFKFTSQSTSLKDILISLGMTSAFSNAADFSGIDGRNDLFIQDAIHKAFVAVDERGTEAAAATAIVVSRITAVPVQPAINFTADRPFIFLIRDNTTGTVLFMGKVVNPVIE